MNISSILNNVSLPSVFTFYYVLWDIFFHRVCQDYAIESMIKFLNLD